MGTYATKSESCDAALRIVRYHEQGTDIDVPIEYRIDALVVARSLRAATSAELLRSLEAALRSARQELWDQMHSHMSEAEFILDPVIEEIDEALAKVKVA